MEACWAHNPEVRGSKPRSAKGISLSHSFLKIIYLVPVACIIIGSTEQPLKIEVAKNLDNPFVVDFFFFLCFLIQLVLNSLVIPEHIESNRNIILTSF